MQKKKEKAGFSYVEVLAAGALFMIVVLGALSLTLGARQNLAFSQENRRLGVAANSLSLAVRDKILGGKAITGESINTLAEGIGIENYSVFIVGANGEHMSGSPFHSSEDVLGVNLSGFEGLARGKDSRFVYVVVYNDYYVQLGRAISVAIGFDHTSGIWRNAGG